MCNKATEDLNTRYNLSRKMMMIKMVASQQYFLFQQIEF